MSTKALGCNKSTIEIEHEIDLLVYDLYGLTPEEIAIVEGTNKSKHKYSNLGRVITTFKSLPFIKAWI